MKRSKEEVRKIYDHRTLYDVLARDIGNIILFFIPMVFVHNLAWQIKPYLTDSDKGPWELIWHKFLDTFGDDCYTIYVYGTFFVTTITFWLAGLVFTLMDFTQKPKFLMRYKVQPGKNAPPDTWKVIKVVLVVLFNQLMGIPAAMLGYHSMVYDIRYVPDVYTALAQVLLTMLLYDALFFHSHWLMHHRSVYKYVHKVHHEWQAPIAIASSYSHPIEFAITTYVAGSAGAFVSGATIPVAWIWYTWLQLNAQCDHSGYHFPMIASPEFHDYHHLKFHTSYGWLSFWDWFYGTDAEFMKTKVHKKRHARLLTAQSAREVYPDD